VQASANLTAANVFENANLVTGSAGGPGSRRSGAALDSSTLASGNATRQFKVLGLSQIDDNAYGSYARALVKINNHVLKGGTGTVGV
jgi:hypothetical protein